MAKSPELYSSLRKETEFFSWIEKVQECWNQFFLEKKDLDGEVLSPGILKAWQECRKNQLDPYDIRRPLVTRKEYQERRKKMMPLIAATKPIFDTFMAESGGIVHTLDLYDADLVFIHTFGGGIATSESRYATPGVCCDPARAGVTAMSLVKEYDCPQRLVGPEHFDAKLHDRICTAVPLYDGEDSGKLIGVINVVEKLQRDALRTLGSLSAIAQGVAFSMQNMKQKEDIKRHSALNQEILETVISGILVVDGEGTLQAANRAALSFLEREQAALIGRPLEEILGADNPFLESLRSGKNIQGINFSLNVNRKTRHFYGNTRKLKGSKGGKDGMIIMFQDMPATRSMLKNLAGWQASMTFDDIIGSSVQMRTAREIASKAAGLSCNILIQGESGTGKEIFAQAIHNGSKYRKGPFISINCAAIPASLIESELFGYENGAFTGARKDGQPGKFELAQDGTIFLDEVNSMPLEMQAKLLRVLQDRMVTRIGGNSRIPLNIRVISASNENLLEMVRMGRFRMDLFYRLNVVTVDIPPLRERPEDIRELCGVFLAGKNLKIDEKAIAQFEGYSWPGNVRELENCLERAGVQANMQGKEHIDEDVIEHCGIMLEAGDHREKRPAEGWEPASGDNGAFRRSGNGNKEEAGKKEEGGKKEESEKKGGSGKTEEAEKKEEVEKKERNGDEKQSLADRKRAEELTLALDRNHWNIASTAKELGVARNTVYNRMKKYGLLE